MQKEWTRDQWLKSGTQQNRQELATQNPLAWILEYQPLIRLPNTGDIVFDTFYAQQQILLDQSQFRAVNKPRQAGITTVNAAGEAVFNITHGDSPEILVLSKGDKETQSFMDKFYLAYHSTHDKDKKSPKIIKENTKYAKFDNGAVVRALTAGKTQGRSYSGTDIYFDEMAFAMYANDIYTGVLPAIGRTGGRLTVFCTPNGKGNLFHRICTNWREMGFNYHQYEWWFVPFYNPYYKETLAAYLKKDWPAQKKWIAKAKTGAWYQKMVLALGLEGFLQEYECNFDVGTDQVFSSSQLNKVFRPNYCTQIFDYGEHWQWVNAPKAEEYYMFTDYGRKRDPTVSVVFGFIEDKWMLVEYQRIQPVEFDWSMVLNTIKGLAAKYNANAFHDGTGAGDVLTAELEGISQSVQIHNGLMSKTKENAINNCKRAMDNQMIVMPKIPQLLKEFEFYRWNDKKIVQDSVIAVVFTMAKCYYANESFIGVDKEFSWVQN